MKSFFGCDDNIFTYKGFYNDQFVTCINRKIINYYSFLNDLIFHFDDIL
jgi:hypothetical protein